LELIVGLLCDSAYQHKLLAVFYDFMPAIR
jgi:hypothetical protein